MSSRDVGTYEMLWDCAACGTKGLLGKSHRHCPACGSPQDPGKRYFPPPEQAKAVENHSYDGADKTCPACSTPMGAKASNCGNCGAPLDGAASVALIGEPKPAPVQAARPRRTGCVVAAVVVVALLGATAAFFLWRKDVSVQVTQHRWERAIDVERLDAVRESEWCDRMPRDAYGVSRSRQQRDTKKIPDGETCSTKNVDNGDGTFKRVEECRPKYREEPIYDDKCAYTVDRWRTARTEKAQGVLGQAENWPTVRLSAQGACRGCEREGPRRSTWTVDLRGPEATYTCDVDEALWRRLRDGQSVPMKVRVLGGGADCASLGAS